MRIPIRKFAIYSELSHLLLAFKGTTIGNLIKTSELSTFKSDFILFFLLNSLIFFNRIDIVKISSLKFLLSTNCKYSFIELSLHNFDFSFDH